MRLYQIGRCDRIRIQIPHNLVTRIVFLVPPTSNYEFWIAFYFLGDSMECSERVPGSDKCGLIHFVYVAPFKSIIIENVPLSLQN
jgi:hypothetical protein